RQSGPSSRGGRRERRCSSPTMTGSKADRLSAEEPSRPGPSNNRRRHNHNPSNPESRYTRKRGSPVAHIPAKAAERNRPIYLPERTKSPKAAREIQLKPRNAI